MGEIFVGTSGFSFPDWIGPVYPAGIKKQEMLPYYEKTLGFTALEVNFSYYTLPAKRTMESFMRRTSTRFSYVMKAYKGITHERGERVKEQIKVFKDGISPLGENMKAVLFQFPYAFVPDAANIDYLKFIREEFSGTNPVVEFRNARWQNDRYMDVLQTLSLGYCVVDEPKIKGLLPFYPVLTSDMGYFRLHGRNEAWFNAPMEVKYNYLYSEEELKEFVGPIKNIAEKASSTFVFFNNCHAGKAVKNAEMLKGLLTHENRN
jgi:uncharacterized protein YecE (DUF72 family)